MAVVAPNDQQAHGAVRAGVPGARDPLHVRPEPAGGAPHREELLPVEGAAIFIGNEYEFGVIEKKNGLDAERRSSACPC